MTKAELKPCPFCGGTAQLKEISGRWAVECAKHCVGTRIFNEKQNPIEAWNRRLTMDWINVKRMTPEPFVSVLCRMPGEKPFPTVHEGYITKDGIWVSNYFKREPGEVTHWAYMPDFPDDMED